MPTRETVALLSRRRFLSRLSIGLGVACAGIIGVPVVGFVVAPIFRKVAGAWRTVGQLDDWTIGETVSVVFEDPSPLPWAGVTARAAAWMRRDGEESFTAFSAHCTHLGCPVRWMPGAKLFLCPCHGGVYYADGSVAAGPPPLPLFRYDTRVVQGEVQIKVTALPITTTL
ncbi:MAG TPA: ubiquinol-cytochrome c reductase iron-sulfur subunit [Opitutus sp.]|nr:ubiquinol-cytochrome c reductase iron-sulfur subunit [Opitutus sp.]